MTRCVWECFQQVVSIPLLGLFQGVFLSDTEVEFKSLEFLSKSESSFISRVLLQ